MGINIAVLSAGERGAGTAACPLVQSLQAHSKDIAQQTNSVGTPYLEPLPLLDFIVLKLAKVRKKPT